MKKRIKVDGLPEFDAAIYLESEVAIAAYLTDILEANDAALLAAALGDIARARGMTEIANRQGLPAKPCTRHCGRTALRVLTRFAGSVKRSVCAWWRRPYMPKSRLKTSHDAAAYY